jgi:hypothetical protein
MALIQCSKYVDSHLRPYKCKHATCVGNQFSSTACLLRHEREAHGMHGHGSKPHVCIFEDCDRAQPGQGFPRRYNLFDHMKRVHDYTPKDTTSQDISPIIGSLRGAPTKKRKSSADQATEKRQKTSGRVQAPIRPHESKADLRAKLESEFTSRKHVLIQQAQQIQPSDLDGLLALSDLVENLKKVANHITTIG